MSQNQLIPQPNQPFNHNLAMQQSTHQTNSYNNQRIAGPPNQTNFNNPSQTNFNHSFHGQSTNQMQLQSPQQDRNFNPNNTYYHSNSRYTGHNSNNRNEDKSNHVLLITVINPAYPITCDVIHQICSPNGKVLRIVIFKKNGCQAMVEFDSVESAKRTRMALHGCDIYSGCCTLKVEFAKPTRLNVYKNDNESYDYTNPNLVPLLTSVSIDVCELSFLPVGEFLRREFVRATIEILVVQYEVRFTNGQECGGAYIKLHTSPVKDLHKVNDATPYTIMFGPDVCGKDAKLHFIFKHKHPKTGAVRKIHFNKANSISKFGDIFKDQKWHAFRLTVRPDNSFEIQVDKKVLAKGSLLEDFLPPVNPPKEIDDPNDKKPEDYDEREKIADPEDRKPDNWDESEPRKIVDPNAKMPSDWLENESDLIPDKDAVMPENWDQEIDGEWQAPLIDNPKCAKVSGCGKWKPPLIDNPKFKGKWKPRLIVNPDFKGPWQARKIQNPDYYEDQFPFKMASIDAVAFELWTISDGVAFDNVLITDNVDVANYILDHTFQLKKELSDAETDNWFVKLIKDTNKRPSLWIIYVLVITIPILLFIGYCCVSPGQRKSTSTTKSDSSTDSAKDDDTIDNQPTSSARLRKTKRAD